MANNHIRLDLERIRQQFPALTRPDGKNPAVFSDAPGGTQIPRNVIQSMSSYLEMGIANLDGCFPTSKETNALMSETRQAVQRFLNAPDNSIVFGANMTSMTFAFSRAISRIWQPGDEIIVSTLDHDANITPWKMVAEERGCVVHQLDITQEQNLSVEELGRYLSSKTRLVAFTLASNSTGSVTPARELIEATHRVGAQVYVDAVHYAAHCLIDVKELNTDFLVCSAYKFCGPHLGLLYGKPELLNSIKPCKVRPAHDYAPNSWETGTQNFEAIAGLRACIDYHAWLSGSGSSRDGLKASACLIEDHERRLSRLFLDGCNSIRHLTVYGSPTVEHRTSTFALTKAGQSPEELSQRLSERGVYTWAGHFYAVDLVKRLQLEKSGGFLRVGFVHYNTEDEVSRVLNELEDL